MQTATLSCPTRSSLPNPFREMLDHLDGMMPKLHDRRVMPRWPFATGATFAAADGDVVEVCTRDINLYNAGFVSVQPIEVGTHVSFRMDLPDGRHFETRARIMRCREFTPGCFEGYINFTHNLPEHLADMVRQCAGK